MFVTAVNTTAQPNTPDKKHSVIYLNACYSPDGTTENNAFWTATPSGIMRLYKQGDHDFVAGQYFYIDITDNPEGDVKRVSKEFQGDSLIVVLQSPNHKTIEGVVTYGQDWLRLEMFINNKSAWPTFDNENFDLTLIPV